MSPWTATRRAQRGVTLVEVLVSMALLAIAMTGVAQLQIVASGANASARMMTRASQLAADVGAIMQQWEYDDPRLAANERTTGETLTQIFVDDQTEELSVAMGYALGDYDGAETRNVRGLDTSLPPASVDERFRVFWWVGEEDQNSDAIPDAKLITVVVRWSEGGRWRNVNFTQARFNPSVLRP